MRLRIQFIEWEEMVGKGEGWRRTINTPETRSVLPLHPSPCAARGTRAHTPPQHRAPAPHAAVHTQKGEYGEASEAPLFMEARGCQFSGKLRTYENQPCFHRKNRDKFKVHGNRGQWIDAGQSERARDDLVRKLGCV